jgi:hypothetical protein
MSWAAGAFPVREKIPLGEFSQSSFVRGGHDSYRVHSLSKVMVFMFSCTCTASSGKSWLPAVGGQSINLHNLTNERAGRLFLGENGDCRLDSRGARRRQSSSTFLRRTLGWQRLTVASRDGDGDSDTGRWIWSLVDGGHDESCRAKSSKWPLFRILPICPGEFAHLSSIHHS